MYLKDSYFSSKPLPVLDRQTEIMHTEVMIQIDSVLPEKEQPKVSGPGKKSTIDISGKLNKSKSTNLSNRLKSDISIKLQQMRSSSRSVKM